MHVYICIIIFRCIEKQQDFCSTILPIAYYAPGTLGINADPDELKDEIRRIRNLPDFTACIELINALDCVIKYPSCSANMNKIVPICQSQCRSIDYQIIECLIHLENNMLISEFQLVHNLLETVECEEPETYYNFPVEYIKINSTDCLMLSKS